MEISVTVPIQVEHKGETYHVAELETVLDITITTPARAAQLYGEPGNCVPAEAAEWIIDTCWLDVGDWNRELKRRVPKIIECPSHLVAIIELWADTREGRDDIDRAIRDDDSAEQQRDAYADSQWRERRLGETA